jgi:hypothetical protein
MEGRIAVLEEVQIKLRDHVLQNRIPTGKGRQIQINTSMTKQYLVVDFECMQPNEWQSVGIVLYERNSNPTFGLCMFHDLVVSITVRSVDSRLFEEETRFN